MAENKPSPFPPALRKRRATYRSRIYRSTAELSHVFRAARRRQSAAAHTAPYLSGPHGASRAETLLGCHFAASRGPPRTPGPGSSHPLHRLPALTALPRRPKRGQPRTSLPPRERPQPSAVAAVPPGPGGGRHAARPPPRAMTQTGAIPRPSPRPGTAPASVRRPLPRPSPRPPPPARQPQRSEPRGRRASRLLTKTYQPPPPPRTEATRPSLAAASPGASRGRWATAVPSCVARPVPPSPHLLGDELVLLAGHHGRWRGAGPAAGRAERRRRRQQREAERRRRLILLRHRPSRRRFPPLRQRQSMRKWPTAALSRDLEGSASAHSSTGRSRRWSRRCGGLRSPSLEGRLYTASYRARISPCGGAQPPQEAEGQSLPRAPPALRDLTVLSVC